MTVLDSHEWVPVGGSPGPYVGGPPKTVLHTTEGSTIAGALAAYRDGGVPHLTWGVRERRRLQHIDTDRAASAMRNLAGGVQTNLDGARQVEIVWFAGEIGALTEADLRWIGEGIWELCKADGIDPLWHARFVGPEAGTIATATAPQRMTYGAWDNFGGVCGHQHVPENHHWDPGRLDYPRIIELMEDDMLPSDRALLAQAARDASEARVFAKAALDLAAPNGFRYVDPATGAAKSRAQGGVPAGDVWRWARQSVEIDREDEARHRQLVELLDGLKGGTT